MATKPLQAGGVALSAQDQADIREQIGAVGQASSGALLDVNGQPYNALAEGDFYLPVLTAAYAATRAGTADTIIAFLGDSTVAGLWANGVQTVGNRQFAPPVVAGNLLAGSAVGLPVSQDAVFGLGTNTGVYGYDSRVTFSSANWNGASLQWLGGCCFRNDTNEASSMNIAFGSTFDTITVYYYQNSGLGSFNISINGGAAIGATVNTSGASDLGVATRTVTSGTHTVNISRLAGANTVLIFGVVVSHSVTKRVRVYNWGAGGTTTADWIQTGQYLQGTAGPLLAPHCVVIKLGINDGLASVTPATYESNLQTLVDLYRPQADVILSTPNPVNSAQISLATQYAYRQRVLTVAKRNGLPCHDLAAAMFGSWDAAVAAGFFGPLNDQIHPSIPGYGMEAGRLARVLEAAAAPKFGGLTGAASTLPRYNASTGALESSVNLVSTANTLEQYSGTTGQGFYVYNTRTDGSNYERFMARWLGNNIEIGFDKAGTGQLRNVWFYGGFSTQFNLDAAFFRTSGGTLNFGIQVNGTPAAVMRLVDGSGSDFNRIALGGITSAYPSLKRSSAILQARLADDSGFTAIQGQIRTHQNAATETITPDKTLILYDAAGTAYKVPCVAA